MSEANQDVNTYNSDGRIIQVEYAMKAMNLGTTTIGVRLENCVILVSEKKLISALQNPESIKKHFKIYDTIVAGVSGVSGDAPTIINKCRNICLNHEKIYKEQISAPKLMEDICELALKFGEEEFEKKIFSRPFGVSLLVAAYEDRPILYSIDPSGSYLEYKARAIGSAHEVVENILGNEFEELTDRDRSIRRILGILKGVMKDEMNQNNVEVSVVSKSGVEMMGPDQVLSYIQ